MAQTEVEFYCPYCGDEVQEQVRTGAHGLQSGFCFGCQKEVVYRLRWEAKATAYKLTPGKPREEETK